MSKLFERIKLAKMLLKLASTETNNGTLTHEGDLVVGSEVFIDKDGELLIAPDGEYVTETSKIEVENGVVTEIEVIEKPADEPVALSNEEIDELKEKCAKFEDTIVPELEAKIKELEADVANRDAIIEENNNKIKELEAKIAELEGTVETQKEALSKVPTSVTKQEPEKKSGLSFAWATRK